MEVFRGVAVAVLALVGTNWAASRGNSRGKVHLAALEEVHAAAESAHDPLVSERPLSAKRALALRIEVRYQIDRTFQYSMVRSVGSLVAAVLFLTFNIIELVTSKESVFTSAYFWDSIVPSFSGRNFNRYGRSAVRGQLKTLDAHDETVFNEMKRQPGSN